MHLRTLFFLLEFYLCYAGYGVPDNPGTLEQADVQAPAYFPPYATNQKVTKTSYTKSYMTHKTGYSGTKTGYHGTKTGYTSTKTGSSALKNGYGGKSGYSHGQSWYSESGNEPTYNEFHSNANSLYTPKCDPECKNNGICVDTNTCYCPTNFHGKFCEFEKKACLTFPPLPMNSKRKCSSELCTISCMPGYKFVDGTTVANMRCVEGQWRSTRADMDSLSDCEPECDPPCLNGGVCLSLNTCQCPHTFRGPQCQYSLSACNVTKIGFNGAYSCFSDDEKFSCKLKCPPGSTYSSKPAELYTCLYSTGIFEPQPIPQCIFEGTILVASDNLHTNFNNSYYKTMYSSRSYSHGSAESQIGDTNYSESSKHTYSYGNGNQDGMIGQSTNMVMQDYTPKGGTCLTWSGAHYKTFDGQIYSFKSPCEHILVRDAIEHKYTVVVKHGECKSQTYCPSQLTIYLEDKPYFLSVGEDGSVEFRSTRRLIPIPASLPGIRVMMPSEYVVVNLDAVGISIKWDTNNLILVEGSVMLWNKTDGLCGILDGNPGNDFKTKEGSLARTPSVMASSWKLNKVGDICEGNPSENSACASLSDNDMKNALQFCTNIFSKEKFRKCSKVMDVSLLIEACQWDYCACTSSLSAEECACNTVSVYAKECLRHGVEEMKFWRNEDTCPVKCPDGKIYKACGPDVQPSCSSPIVSPVSNSSTCVEGCFCADGLYLESGKCLQKNECPCRFRSKSFPPGSSIPVDCNTCTCESGEWVCTQLACGARCGAMGDPHYTTFDGTQYDFMGHCTYTMLQTQNLTVDVENVACSAAITEAMKLSRYDGEGKPSCTKAVNLNYGGVSIHMKQGGLILVNGQEVSTLPVHVGDILIRAASSLFIIVQLPNSVDLWWDGDTRVFIDVPAEYSGKTKGLCGTFNKNQKDDFLTPEGDIEQTALAFANKWKTKEFCDDLDVKEPEHPCKINVENKEIAEKYCGKLKSKLFEPCHWVVDVEPFYQSCMYDMCACGHDVSHCLCPILGDYATACARAGELIQWRYNVKECKISCDGGQEYTVCADSCQRTCADVALAASGKCKPTCVEGCACASGQVLDEHNTCIPVGLCPCFHNGLQFNAGYKEVRAGRREQELCTCVGARWDCQPATDNDIQNYPPAEDIRTNCSAVNHMEFTTCEIAELPTCKNMHLPSKSTTAECRPGCQCKKGYVLDTSSKACVVPTQCPCHHGGRSYPDGHVMKEECNECECKSGNWTCTHHKCTGVCTAWGDSHIITFDGMQYDFEGVCTYLLAKGYMDGNDGFDVEIQNVPCGTTGATCSKSVTLKVGGNGNEEVVSLTRDAPLPDISKLKRIKLRIAGVYVFLDVPSLGISLQWDRELRVYVKVDAMWQNRVKGLCGNFNSDGRDDFQTPSSGGGISESSALIFADSWKLQPMCSKPQPVMDHCTQRPERKEWATSTCSVMKRYPFTLCHSEVPPAAFVDRCERDACACDSGEDCACACAALAAYAYACATRGITFKWRTPHLCPMQCDAECSSYDACLPACPLETCDNTLYYQEIKTTCERDTCVEGCKLKQACPEGSVYSNNTFTSCVPRAKCRPVCMTLKDGTEILEGEIIEEDACHTCRCSKKEKICTGKPCTTEKAELIVPTTETYETQKPHDEPLKCVTGWSEWVNRGPPETSDNGISIDKEPLPKPNELSIGSPMCEQNMMTKIECRTVTGHKTPKETGLDVECSLEQGLICKEAENVCPDFEIRVYCECKEEPFQCLDSNHPNYPHPSDCKKFYECTPNTLNPNKPHTVLKDCAEGLMYNPVTMVCDWPNAVIAVKPECEANDKESKMLKITPLTTISTSTTLTTTTTVNLCPPGLSLADCPYRCDQMCDHFKKTLQDKGQCIQDTCVKSCIDEKINNTKCGPGSMWRDEQTCVPLKDCTCYHLGKIVKPNGVVTDGCTKCQCLDNKLHCDSSDCEIISTPSDSSRNLPYIVSTLETSEAPFIVKTTVSPPPECAPNRYKDLLWEGEPLPDSAFSASSVASELFEPQYAKLNGRPLDVTAGSWNPKHSDQNQYIQVELSRREPIYGVMMQGSPLFNQYVTSYEVMYGDDGNIFHTVDDAEGKPKVFRGPINNKDVMKQIFEKPIEAKFVRLHPLTWHDDISVRFELIGCGEPTTTLITLEPIQCDEPLGLSANLPVDNIRASSNNDGLKHLDLNDNNGWKPAFSTPGEWVLFDFTAPRNITGLKTKGGSKGWVTSYNVMYSNDETVFMPVVNRDKTKEIFPANFDTDTLVMNQIRPPVQARYLKVLPLEWKNAIEMRIEPIGCFEPYPVTSPTPIPLFASTPSPCEVCPGVETTENCACAPPHQYFDGENCVARDQCPCVHAFMTYAVGSVFRGSNCDECVCKLGGVSDCKPVKECQCEPNLVPKLSSYTCECRCEPCPKNTKMCPSVKICLPLEKWCNGVQDCPDDEVICETTTAMTTTEETTTVTTEPLVVTTVAPTVANDITTTAKPAVCPKVECPPGYVAHLTPEKRSYTTSISDLPPPRPRITYQRYYKGNAKGGSKKGGFSKTGFSKGGYGGGNRPQSNQAFSLEKPKQPKLATQKQQECAEYRCVPRLPPPPHLGATSKSLICSAPACPPQYSLQLDSAPAQHDPCPQYVCVPPPERPLFCNMTGRTFNTFDGTEYKYDICFHILARENKFDAWTVVVRKKCRADNCQNELMIRQDDEIILVKANFMIEYDNYEYTVEQSNMICFQKNIFDIDRLGNGIAIKSRKYDFSVFFSTDGDVKIGVSKKLMGTIDGLCGAFDGEPSNDRRLPDGRLATSIDEFGHSWAKPGLPLNACKTKVVTAEKQKEAWELCDVLTKEPISKCGKVLNLAKWRSICLEKICECADLVVNGTKKSEEQCRCLIMEQLVAECLAADKNLNIEGWRMQMDCPAECPPPLVHYDCYRKRCEPTCSSVGSTIRSCPVEEGQCFPGCYCPEGKLRKGDKCVLPSDCLDCACDGGGSPAKYITFERDDLPFGGNNTYLASRNKNATGQYKYEVYVTTGQCEENIARVCTKIIHLLYEGKVIHISKDPATKELVTIIDKEKVYKYPTKKDWITISRTHGQDVVVLLPDVHLELTVLQSKLEFSLRVPSYLYANKTEGLCGVCAGYQEHLVTSNGTVTDDFEEYGKSWKAKPEMLTKLDVPLKEQDDEAINELQCVPPPPENNPCYNIYNEEKFGACHALVEPQSYVESCSEELCALNTSDVCGALQRYAADCARHGICLNWRGELCPYPCTEPLVYRPCVDCERTCENYDELTENPEKCEKQPAEGCFCPEGKVRVNNTCIEPMKCFPCDANKEHYAGEEWQEDACTKCTCSKLPRDERAHVSCSTVLCAPALCSEDEHMITEPTEPGQCCPKHLCVPKPQKECEEPKKIECGFGQVLKLKSNSNGCKEFVCECKPVSECEHIPNENEVEILEAGMERVLDTSGCCPRVRMECRRETCPLPPACPQFHELRTTNTTGKCCPEYQCELPKDKCLVKLEWKAASKGGEERRSEPEMVLKDVEAVWLDGPCRSCRCQGSDGGDGGAAVSCGVTWCAVAQRDDQFVWEELPVPFACCPRLRHVACRHHGAVYRVGENWTSPANPCETYHCNEVAEDKLEIATTLQTCNENCQPGWEYQPAEPSSDVCCGSCQPIACVVEDRLYPIGMHWTSPDFCTNYTCANLNGTLQVQSSNETCPEASATLKEQFVLKEEKIPGKCCETHTPIACRVGDKVYQEGESWQSADPCVNQTCSRDAWGGLSITSEKRECDDTCSRGWTYVAPTGNVCCGYCQHQYCVTDGALRAAGETWQSADNCTTYSCERVNDDLVVTSSRDACPDVSNCHPEDLVNDTCCQICREKPQALSTCHPESLPNTESIGIIRVKLGPHGLCVNKNPLPQFKECRGGCNSGTIYNNQTGGHDSKCECCQAVNYSPVDVEVSCEDGTTQTHRVASPQHCRCMRCGESTNKWPTKTGTKNVSKQIQYPTIQESEIPEMYMRYNPNPQVEN